MTILFILYLGFVFAIYYIISYYILENKIIIDLFYKNNGLLSLFNLIPFRNILNYIINNNAFNTKIIIYNLLYPILLYIPIGYFVQRLFGELYFVKNMLVFVLCNIIFMLVRALFLIGFCDIDKIILTFAGFTSGYILGICLELFIKWFRILFVKG